MKNTAAKKTAEKKTAAKKTPAKKTAAKKTPAPPPTDESSSDSDDDSDSSDSDSDSSDSDSDSSDSDEAVLASGNDKLIFKRQQNSGVSIDFGRQVPSTATIVRNRGDGDCGYLAFGQWLQKYKRLPEEQTRCNALRGIVANFNLQNSPCNGIVNNAVFEARKKKARKPGAWMQDEELIMLACHFKICVVVYKDYSDTATINYRSGPQANTDLNAVTYTEVNSDSCNEFLVRDSKSTMWLWNNMTTLGVPHYELLVDVTYVDVA